MRRKISYMPQFYDKRIYVNRNAHDAQYRGGLFYLNAAGISYPHKDYYITEHYRNHYSFQYIFSGKGYISCGGKRTDFSAGDILYLGAKSGIEYGTYKDEPLFKIWFNGFGSFFAAMETAFGLDSCFDIIHTDKNHNIPQYFHRIIDIAPEAEKNPEAAMKILIDIGSYIYRRKNGEYTEETYKSEPALSKAEEIQHYIDMNLAGNIKLSQIASHFGVTERTVYNHFTEAFGTSPKEYIINKKLEQAQNLLSGNACSISDICESLGFGSTAYFGKCFKSKYGLTPKQYRQIILKNKNE